MIDAYFRAFDAAMNVTLGAETVTLRRSLRLTRPDGSPAVDLLVVALTHAGATSVRLRAADGPLEGYAGRGLSVALGGHTYPVAEDCERGIDGTVLMALASPLLADAAADAPATVSDTVEWALPACLVYYPREEVLPTELSGRVSFAVSVPQAASPQQPEIGDALTSSTGSGVVLGFLPPDGGSWELAVGQGRVR